MASTYTNNLGIQKPGTGDQSGTWGDTVNLNSDILDVGTNGVLTLTLSGASSTLTTSDGIVSNGQYKLLSLAGSPTAGHVVTISPNDAQKVYHVFNNTSVTVVFTQGSGGNYTLMAGESAILYANGVGAASVVAKFNVATPVRQAVVASTSGTSINFTSIPAGVNRITVMLQGVSTSGTSALLIQLGISSGVETTGYTSNFVNPVLSTSSSSTAGFIVTVPSTGSNTQSGIVTICNITGNTFVSSGNVSSVSTSSTVNVSAGQKALAGVLDRIRITTVNGTDTFDAGNINIMYET